MGVQEALAKAAMADLRELASTGSPSAATTPSSPKPDVRDMTFCNTNKNGPQSWASEPSRRRTGFPPSAKPPGNRRPSRNTANAIGGQQPVAGGKFDPSAAVHEINRALQTTKRSRSALSSDETTRAI